MTDRYTLKNRYTSRRAVSLTIDNEKEAIFFYLTLRGGGAEVSLFDGADTELRPSEIGDRARELGMIESF